MRSARHSRSSWLAPRSASAGYLSAAGGVSAVVGALAASAVGAVALGAVAIGALAVREFAVRRARARVLIVDKLVINRLVVRNIERPARGGQSRAARATNGSGAEIDYDTPLASPTQMKPGDDAVPGTPGTGDEICPQCGGAGVIDSQRCENCEGTGHITKAIGG